MLTPDTPTPASARSSVSPWPELPLAAWADTYATLHMYTLEAGWSSADV